MIDEKLKTLRSYKDAHLKIGELILKADNYAVFPLDFLAVAVLNRSISLIAGFSSLIEARNFTCAAPLVRLQIDNCLRFHASVLVNDPHELAISILQGTPVRKLKSKTNEKMTDHFLVESLSKQYTWIKGLYERASGYIHLSENHIFNTIFRSDSKEVFNVKIGFEDTHLSEEIYVSAIDALIQVTEILLRYLYGWAFTKENPKAAYEMRTKNEESNEQRSEQIYETKNERVHLPFRLL